jgi:hypothetical protein
MVRTVIFLGFECFLWVRTLRRWIGSKARSVFLGLVVSLEWIEVLSLLWLAFDCFLSLGQPWLRLISPFPV